MPPELLDVYFESRRPNPIEQLFRDTLSVAPDYTESHRNNLVICQSQWHTIRASLSPSVRFTGDKPTFPIGVDFIRNENLIYTPTSALLTNLMHFGYAKQLLLSQSHSWVIAESMKTATHEDAHAHILQTGGADWWIFGMEVRKFQNKPVVNAFVSWSGTMSIVNYVRLCLAPDDPSPTDLASVGLNEAIYKTMLLQHQNPVDEVLRPWREAGMI